MSAATLDTEALGHWLTQGFVLPGTGPVEMARLGEGHSNLTYRVTRDGADAVLRRPPRGPLLPTAHDVLREARVLELLRLHAPEVPVPQVLGVCADPAIIGAPFYVMGAVDGYVIHDVVPAALDTPDLRRSIAYDVPRTLGHLHRGDWRPFVEAGIGRETGYLGRQLRRWTGQREGIQAAVAAAGGRARELADYDVVRDWLVSNVPAEEPPAIVHGDFKVDNLVVTAESASGTAGVAAVVDWEMATVGDPRADLGYLLSFWPEPGEVMPLSELVAVLDASVGRAEVAAIWEETTGRTAGDTRWFVALAVWKLAILLEASYHRWLAGTADDPFFAGLETAVPALLARAREECGA